MALDVVYDQRARLLGHEVAVQGALLIGQTVMQAIGCGAPCCHTSWGVLGIGQDERGSLRLDLADDAYACRGDETMTCCELEARGQNVVAVGTLGSGGGPVPRLYLERATVCASR